MEKIFILFITLFIAFLWGIQPICHRYLEKDIDFMSLFIITWIFSTIIIIIIYIWHYDKVYSTFINIKNKDIYIIIIIAFTIIISKYLYFNIIYNYNITIFSSICYSSPLFTLILAYFLLNENINLQQIIGIILILFGSLLLTLNLKM
uniref:EamA domain-containing protein n=1 Tax=viral metagenome TaxID=1070528 RepID=A0A6C0J0B7_9ZZZZ